MTIRTVRCDERSDPTGTAEGARLIERDFFVKELASDLPSSDNGKPSHCTLRTLHRALYIA